MFFQSNGKETAKAERRAMKEPFPLPRGHRNKALLFTFAMFLFNCASLWTALTNGIPHSVSRRRASRNVSPSTLRKKERILSPSGRNAPPGNKDERDAENGRGPLCPLHGT